MVLGGLVSVLVLLVLMAEVEVLFGLVYCSCLFIGLLSWEYTVEAGGIVGLDLVSSIIVILSLYISLLIFLSSVNVKRFNGFGTIVLLICVILIMAFSLSSIFLFYICFESVLIPTLLLILGWGYQPERIQAVNYILLYTVAGSMPLIYGFSLIYSIGVSSSMLSLAVAVDNVVMPFCWVYVVGFLVNLPVFPFHLWLPNAHVEAPVSGSMILAGLLLNLGGYGFIRVCSLIEFGCLSWIICVVLGVGLFGGILTSVICLRQCDLNALVAYSSIGHMSFVLLGVVTNLGWGVLGGVLIMLGHGLCSSGLFSLVNYIYNVSGSRLIGLNKGYLLISPTFSFVCFLLCVSNIASPPTLNLFGEVLVFVIGGVFSLIVLVILGVISFIAACYSLYIYVGSQHGNSVSVWVNNSCVSMCTLFVLLIHWLPLNFLFIFIPWPGSLF